MTRPENTPALRQWLGRLVALQQFRFLLVGGSAALLYFVLFTLAMQRGCNAVLAACLAYGMSFVVSYLAQKRFAFRSGSGHATSLPRYALLQGACAATAMASAALSVRAGLSDVHVLGLVTTLALGAVSYVLSSRWVFVK